MLKKILSFYRHVEFWQFKPPEQEQLGEQKPPNKPESEGQLVEFVKINCSEYLIKIKAYYLHFEFWQESPSTQAHNEEQNPPKDLELAGQLKKITLIFINFYFERK